MTVALTVTYAIYAVVAFAFLMAMLRWDLQMFQQNSYFPSRYTKWLRQSDEHTSIKRLVPLVAMVALMVPFVAQSEYVVALLALALVLTTAHTLRQKSKLPLKYTKRIKLHICLALTLAICLAAGAYLTGGIYDAAVSLTALTIISPLLTLLANWLLTPYRNYERDKFLNAAKRKLASMPDLIIVGVTGSYGKTSTRTFLGEILSEHYSVCLPPGNFNTTLGVTRTINEVLRPYDQVYVCEMGAKNVGDIKEICDIVHPRYGIVTAVGEMHLETFKSVENVQRTKFELVDALPADGMAVLNNDWPNIANRPVSDTRVTRYAMNDGPAVDYHIENLRYHRRGATFNIVGRGHDIELNTRLVGESNISNLLAAVIVAIELNVPEAKIRAAVSRIEQVEHRLSMRQAGGITIIDDAYNSNPVGSRMALDVLSQMEGQRFVITPGMIELGSVQAQRNREFGQHIAHTADVAIIACEVNREDILQGLRDENFPADKIHTVANFEQGYQLMLSLAKAGDTVLIENDLPDTFK